MARARSCRWGATVGFDDISEIVSAQRAGLGRGRAPPCARNQEPVDAHPAVCRTPGNEAVGQARPCRTGHPRPSRSRPIVDQVDAMKRLVNEFRDYAAASGRAAAPDLNALIADVLHLYGEENASCPRESRAGPSVVLASQAMRNSCARSCTTCCKTPRTPPCRHGQRARNRAVRSHLDPVERVPGRVRLSISDSGTGFPPHILQRAFEPYVTTKARGTGLGLAVVKKSPTSMAPALICPTAWKTASARRASVANLPQKPRWCLSHLRTTPADCVSAHLGGR